MKFENLKPKTPVPLEINLRPGSYKWCGCGRTKTVPWCDGTCKGGKPVRFKLEQRTAVKICTCGRTKTPPYCDGSHISFGVAQAAKGHPARKDKAAKKRSGKSAPKCTKSKSKCKKARLKSKKK